MKIYEYQIKRVATELSLPDEAITTSKQAEKMARELIYHDEDMWRERVSVLCLNASGKLIGYSIISEGSVSACHLVPNVIAKVAVGVLAAGVILVHNHPSGDKRPSPQDIKQTDALRKGLAFLYISLMDHIILTTDSYFSFSDN